VEVELNLRQAKDNISAFKERNKVVELERLIKDNENDSSDTERIFE